MIRKHTYKDFEREWRQHRIREIQASLEKFTRPQDGARTEAIAPMSQWEPVTRRHDAPSNNQTCGMRDMIGHMDNAFALDWLEYYYRLYTNRDVGYQPQLSAQDVQTVIAWLEIEIPALVLKRLNNE